MRTAVIANLSMSLDGFVSDRADGVQDLFHWYRDGDVEVPTAVPETTFRTSAASAAHLREAFRRVGALVTGRRTFDLAGGWRGRHPMGVPVFVVTHRSPEGHPPTGPGIVFVTDGVRSAVEQARAAAGDRWVGVASPDITRQCLALGLLDEVRVDLVPVLLGSGVPLFAGLDKAPVRLDGPTVIQGRGVTHLYYRIDRGDRDE